MTKRTKTRIQRLYEPEPLDIKTFITLFRAVMRYGFNDNYTQASRFLCVDRRIIKRWTEQIDDGITPDVKNHWMNDILVKLSQTLISKLSQHSRKAYRERAYRLRSELRGLKLFTVKYTPDGHKQELPDETLDADAPRLVLMTLAEAPGMTRTLKQLQMSTGFSRRVIRAAADRLCLTKDVRGYGPDKEAYYSIPLPSDDYTDDEDD